MSVIAIDGPAGAGKTTVAKGVAARLGWHHLDTGAMYRALALAVVRSGASPESGTTVAAIADRAEIVVEPQRVLLDGEDVTEEIRTAAVTAAVPYVAGHESARRALVELQRQVATQRDVVMEGRDIGTAVLPRAELKIYLTASLSERAARRWRELGENGGDRTALEKLMAERDAADSSREISPLRKADDAVVIDSSGLSIEDVIEAIVAAARERGLLQKDDA